MATTTNVKQVVLNILTQAQYTQLEEQGQVNQNELYGVSDLVENASDINYSNTESGLTATNVQGAVDELATNSDRLSATLEDVLQREVIQLTTNEMLEALATNGYPDGQLAICKDDLGYFIGNLYQFKAIEGTPVTYTWQNLTHGNGLSSDTMVQATTTKMFVNGEVYICANGGAYLLGHIYKYNITTDTPPVLSWIDITPTGSVVNQISNSTTQSYSADFAEKRFVQKVLVESLYLQKASGSNLTIVADQPEVSDGNLIATNTTNVAIDYSTPELVAKRTLSADLQLTDNDSIVFNLFASFSRNARILFGANAFVGTTQIASNQTFNWISVDNHNTLNASFRVKFDLLSNPQIFNSGDIITINIFKQQESDTALESNYYFGISVSSHIYYSTASWQLGGEQKVGNSFVFKTLTEAGYNEPSTAFNATDFLNYCQNFNKGDAIISVGGEIEADTYPFLANFILAKADNGLDNASVAVKIENISDSDTRLNFVVEFNDNANNLIRWEYLVSANYSSGWVQTYPITIGSVGGLSNVFNGTTPITDLQVNGQPLTLNALMTVLNPINENNIYVRVGVADGNGSLLQPYNTLAQAFSALTATKGNIEILDSGEYTLPTTIDTANLSTFIGLKANISGDMTLSKNSSVYHFVNYNGNITVGGDDITVLIDGALIGNLTITGQRARLLINFFDTTNTITGETNIIGGSKVGRFVYDQEDIAK